MGDEIETMRSVMGNKIETTRSVMGDEIEMTRSVALMSFGSRTRTRMTTPISFVSRTRLVLGGEDLDGDTSAGVRSRWDDLIGAISPMCPGLGRDLAHSLSLSLRVCEPGNDLKVKQRLHSFSESKALFYDQSK